MVDVGSRESRGSFVTFGALVLCYIMQLKYSGILTAAAAEDFRRTCRGRSPSKVPTVSVHGKGNKKVLHFSPGSRTNSRHL